MEYKKYGQTTAVIKYALVVETYTKALYWKSWHALENLPTLRFVADRLKKQKGNICHIL